MQNELDKDEYFTLSKVEGFKIFSIFAVFAVIWASLMIVLPLSVIIGYFTIMVVILAALWMSPRIVDVGIEDNGNFVKVDKVKKIYQMTQEEIAIAFEVVMDSNEQERLLNIPEDPNAWMLSFVYDSSLLKQLEEYSKKLDEVMASKKYLEENLPNKEKDVAKIKV